MKEGMVKVATDQQPFIQGHDAVVVERTTPDLVSFRPMTFTPVPVDHEGQSCPGLSLAGKYR